MTNRAYSILTVKAVEEDRRVIRGVATTPKPDRVGDIVEPLGVKFANPMPLLFHHDHRMPVGLVKFDAPTADGIKFEAELPTIDEAGALRDRVDEAWQSVKHGLVSAVSIGFRPLEYSWMDEGGIRFIECEVYELSLVTIPAQPDAVIERLKSMGSDAVALIRKFDGQQADRSPAPTPPAATGKSARVVRLTDAARDGAKPFIIRTIKR